MATRDDFRFISRLGRTAIAVVAVATSCSCVTAVVGLFDSAGSTPWFADDQAGLVAHCASTQKPAQRHACLQAAALRATGTRVAWR